MQHPKTLLLTVFSLKLPKKMQKKFNKNQYNSTWIKNLKMYISRMTNLVLLFFYTEEDLSHHSTITTLITNLVLT